MRLDWHFGFHELMKIIQYTSSGVLSGAERIQIEIFNGLRKRNLPFVIVIPHHKPWKEDLKKKGFCVREIKQKGKLDLLGVLRFYKMVKEEEADIVHTHLSTASFYGGLTGKIFKIPTVSTVHCESSKWSFMFSHHLIAVSNSVKEHLIKQGVSAEKITVIPNGIPIDRVKIELSKEDAKNKLGFGKDDILLGVVGKLTPRKGHRYLLEALKDLTPKFPKLKLLVVGLGELRDELERLSMELGISKCVFFLGFRTDVPLILKALDLFVFPSLREGMPQAVMEAMLSNLPVIATSVSGIPELIRDGVEGMLVPPMEADALREKIILLLNDKELRYHLGKNAKERIEKDFSVDKMVDKTLEVFHHLVETLPGKI